MNAHINPSPFYTSIGDLLAHFHFHFHSIDARPALLERDALWASENTALHAELKQLGADLANRNLNKKRLNLGFKKVESERMKSKKLEEKIVEMESEVAQLRADNISVEAELKEKMCVLVDRVLDLEKQKKTVTEKFEASERNWSAKIQAMGKGYVAQEEFGRVLKEKMDLESRYKRMEKESIGKISKLGKTVVLLQREKAEQGDEIGRVSKEKFALKTGIKILEKKAAGLELDIAKRDFTIGRHLKEKIYLEFQNKILEIEARAHREKKDSNQNTCRSCAGGDKEVKEELCEKIKVLEKKKGRLEDEVDKRKNKRILKLVKTIEMLRDDKRVNAELIVNLSSSLEKETADKVTQMGRVLEEKIALDELKSCLENEVEKKKTILQLGKILKALQDDKKERVEAEIILKPRSSFETEKATEISRVLEEKMALEELKSYLKEESEKRKRNWERKSFWVSELRVRNGMVEKEKTEKKAQV